MSKGLIDPPGPRGAAFDACTLDQGAFARRMAEFRGIGMDAVQSEYDGTTLTTWFAASDAAEAYLRDLAERERSCCSFMAFTVERADARIALRITAAPDAAAALDGFARILRDGMPRR